jgi:hypothetical protein
MSHPQVNPPNTPVAIGHPGRKEWEQHVDTIVAGMTGSNMTTVKNLRVIYPDGTVDINSDIWVADGNHHGVSLGWVRRAGMVTIVGNIKNVESFPQRVKIVQFSPLTPDTGRLCSIKGIKRVDNYVDLEVFPITSLKGIENINVDIQIGRKLYIGGDCTHLVGLAYLPGVNAVQLGRFGPTIDVIHDPFLWQEKLLGMGLVEQAQL